MNLLTENPESKSTRFVALACALLITGLIFAGYLVVRARRAQKEQRADAVSSAQQSARKNQPVELQVFEDEAYTKNSQAIIGGTVRNLSNRALPDLLIEMELIHREDASRETRTINVEPGTLAAGAEGKYRLTLSAREWSAAHLLRIVSGEGRVEIGYKSEQGAPRPLMTPTLVRSKPDASQPKPRRPSDDFYNTPDSAEVIR